MTTRSMAYSVIARHNTWDADPSAETKVAAVPFKGMSLFGDALDCCLVENKDKKKVLPSKRKDSKTRKHFHSF